MSTTIHRSYNCTSGTLNARYTFNDTKGKYKLENFTFKNTELTTEVALAKVWVNGFPVAHLKGFKSDIISEEGTQLAVHEDFYEISLKEPHFTTIALTIKVSGDREQILQLEVPENLKGMGLKKLVARELGIALTSVDIQHEGYSIENGTLSDSGFKKGTELTLKLSTSQKEIITEREKITDGALETFSTTKFVKPEAEKIVSFSKEAPKWRILSKGLNLKAECTSKTCAAFKQMIWIPKGMGTFSINEESAEAACPECKNLTDKDVTNCALWNCTYSFQGKMADNTLFKQENKIAPKDGFITFEEMSKGESTIKDWKYLKITTAPIRSK